MNKAKIALKLGFGLGSPLLIYVGLRENKNILNNEIVEFIDKIESIN